MAAIKKRHNPLTRGNNTTKRGPLWAIRQRVVGRGADKKVIIERVRVPVNKGFDPELLEEKHLPEPFDALKLDWAEEAYSWSQSYGLRTKKTPIGNGLFEYKYFDGNGGTVLTIVSPRSVSFDVKPRRRRKRGAKAS